MSSGQFFHSFNLRRGIRELLAKRIAGIGRLQVPLFRAFLAVICACMLTAPNAAMAGKVTATTTTLASSVNPAAINQTVNLVATVSKATASGTVTFRDGAATLGVATLVNGTANYSATFSTSGAHSLTAAYSGSTTFGASTSSAFTENITTVVLTPTTTTISSGKNPAATGQYFTLMANVSPSSATGTVTFKEGSTVLGTANLTSGLATFDRAYFFALGNHIVTAVYSGSAAYGGSTSSSLTEVITTVPTSTGVSVFGPQVLSTGESVTIEAVVQNQLQSNLSGTLTLYDGTKVIGSGAVAPYVGTCCGLYYYTMSYTLAGFEPHSISAKYSGDTNNAPSTSAPNVLSVLSESITTILQIGVNGPAPYYVNAPIPITAIIYPSKPSTINDTYQKPFGTVTLKEGTTTVGTIDIISNTAGEYIGIGSATFAATGSHSITASYSGFYDFMPTTLAKPITITVGGKSATTTLIDSSANPAAINQSFNLTALVTGPGVAPTGTVTFKDGTTTLGDATLSNGYATYPASYATSGTHSFSAVYKGDSTKTSSTSSALSVTINSKKASTTSLTATPNPMSIGEPMLLAATITSGTTGTVTFKDGTSILGTATVSNGQGNFTTSLTTNGVHYLTASYGGDTIYNSSKSFAIPVQVGSGAEVSSPGAMTWVYTYDASNNLSGIVDPNGNSTSFGYDGLNHNTSVILPASNIRTTPPTITKSFDSDGRILSIVDPRANMTSYSYDGLSSMPLSVSSPDTGVGSVGMNARRDITSATDARGIGKTFAYDDVQRLLSINYPSDPPTVFEYDGGSNPAPFSKGRMTKMTDESGVTNFAYDIYGHVISKDIQVGSKNFGIAYTWSESGTSAGKLTSIRYPSGSVVNYSYDAGGMLSGITVNPVNANGIGSSPSAMSLVSGVSYNAAHLPLGWTWASGITYSRTYDSFGRLSSYQLGNPAGTGVAAGLTRTLTYDNAGQVTAFTHTNSAGPQSTFNNNFAYDGLSRLFSASVGGTWYGYDYDANGNRTDRLVAGVDYRNDYSATSNQLLHQQTVSGNTVAYIYDAMGNVTFDGTATYGYDNRGRMNSAVIGTNTIGYHYNAIGQRVSKTGPISMVQSGAAYYMYDEAGQLLGEYDINGNVINETIYMGATPVAAMKTSGAASNGTLFVSLFNIYADHLNSPRVITRQADAAIAWRWDQSEPFGASVPNDNPNGLGTFVFHQRFPGQVFDEETGKFYNYFRDYDPQTGRYAESDPIGLKGGISTYRYVSGNPINSVDLLGLADHSYSWSVFRCLGNCTAQTMSELTYNPAPGVNLTTPVQTGDINTVGMAGYTLGPIMTVVSPETNTIWNLTMPGHDLYPGWVQREVVFDGKSTWVKTTGGGDGPNPWLNDALAPIVWGGTTPMRRPKDDHTCH